MLSLVNQAGKILCVWAPKMIVVTLLIFPSPWIEIQIIDFRSKLVQNIKYNTNEVTRTLLNDMMIFLLKGSLKAENIPCAVIISGTSFLAIYKLLSVQGLFSLNRRPSTFLKQKTKPGSNPIGLVATHKLWFYDASRSRDDKVPPCVKLRVVEQGDIWRRFSQLPSFLLSTLLSYNEHNPQRQIIRKCVKIETTLPKILSVV